MRGGVRMSLGTRTVFEEFAVLSPICMSQQVNGGQQGTRSCSRTLYLARSVYLGLSDLFWHVRVASQTPTLAQRRSR